MKTPLVSIAGLIPNAILDIRYASQNNITGKVLYDKPSALLGLNAAKALAEAASLLADKGYQMVIWDANRPKETQIVLQQFCTDERYVSSSSMHCKGLAVDLTLADRGGKYLDMGTDFDDFSERAHLNALHLTEEQKVNRETLASAMCAYGFRQWPYEWWHFDYIGTK